MLRHPGAPRAFETTPGYAVGVVLTVPPFPYRFGYATLSRGLPIVLSSTLTEADHARLHFSEVARDAHGQLVTSGVTGYIGVATGVGATVQVAQQNAYALARQVHVPNLRYRVDIGDAFLARGHAELIRLGYMSESPSSRR